MKDSTWLALYVLLIIIIFSDLLLTSFLLLAHHTVIITLLEIQIIFLFMRRSSSALMFVWSLSEVFYSFIKKYSRASQLINYGWCRCRDFLSHKLFWNVFSHVQFLKNSWKCHTHDLVHHFSHWFIWQAVK